MSKVAITVSLLDDLAEAISEKTGETLPLTISDMTDAVDGIVIPSAGVEGTPVATKGSVSNHSVSITPSVTNVGGVIQGGTHSGTPVTVSASELVSGSQTVASNQTVDVTNLASVTVAVPIVTYYTGSSDPSSSLGQNGDIYLKVVS